MVGITVAPGVQHQQANAYITRIQQYIDSDEHSTALSDREKQDLQDVQILELHNDNDWPGPSTTPKRSFAYAKVRLMMPDLDDANPEGPIQVYERYIALRERDQRVMNPFGMSDYAISLRERICGSADRPGSIVEQLPEHHWQELFAGIMAGVRGDRARGHHLSTDHVHSIMHAAFGDHLPQVLGQAAQQSGIGVTEPQRQSTNVGGQGRGNATGRGQNANRGRGRESARGRGRTSGNARQNAAQSASTLSDSFGNLNLGEDPTETSNIQSQTQAPDTQPQIQASSNEGQSQPSNDQPQTQPQTSSDQQEQLTSSERRRNRRRTRAASRR